MEETNKRIYRRVQGICTSHSCRCRNTLIIGTQLGDSLGAYILAINKQSNALIWKTKVDSHPAAVITQSAVVSGNRIYVGVSSDEEGFATDSTYPCCSFRGSMLCLDLQTGTIIWKTYMVSWGKGFSGGAVWGSTPVIDLKRNSVYIAIGMIIRFRRQYLIVRLQAVHQKK